MLCLKFDPCPIMRATTIRSDFDAMARNIGERMHVARLGRIVRSTATSAMAFAAVFAAVLLATPSARAHGGVSIGIGFGFPAFVGVPIYSPPVYYVPPPVYYSSPYVGYYGPPPLHRRHYHRVRHYRHCCDR